MANDQISKNAAAAQQAAITPSGCKACQRTGLPIMPLRVAAVLNPFFNEKPEQQGGETHLGMTYAPKVPPQSILLKNDTFQYGIRTPRTGYLYVLCDKSDWYAYEITQEGHFRQFPIKQPPEGKIESLSTACLTQNHDVPAAFINIDANRYQEAWFALTTDIWDEKVRNGYLSGELPNTRFLKVNLAQLKSSPDSIPEAIPLRTANIKNVLAQQVLEFNQSEYLKLEPLVDIPTHFGKKVGELSYAAKANVHGFFTRTDRLDAFEAYIHQKERAGYKDKICALVLPDPVGILQELNGWRAEVIEERQHFNEEKSVKHRFMIASAIEMYFSKLKQFLDDGTANVSNAAKARAGLGMKLEKEHKIKAVAKSYNPVEMTLFNKKYMQNIELYQKKLDKIGEDLAAYYALKGWLDIINHDFNEASERDWCRQFLLLSSCIQGGSTCEHTTNIWEQWIKDSNSPAYKGLFGTETAALRKIYEGTDGYSNFKTLATSDEVAAIVRANNALPFAVVERIGSITGVLSRLGEKLPAFAIEGAGNLTEASIYSLTGEKPVVATARMPIGEAQKFMKTVRVNQATVSLKLGDSLQKAFKEGSFSAVANEVLSTNILPGEESRMVTVKFVANQPLETLETAIQKSGSSVNSVSKGQAIKTTIEKINELFPAGALEPSEIIYRVEGGGQKVITFASEAEFQSIARTFHNSKQMFSGNGIGMVLAPIMVLLQVQKLNESLNNVKKFAVDRPTTLGLTSNIFMIASSITETFGFGYATFFEKGSYLEGFPANKMIRLGGMIGGAAAILDGFGALVSASESYKQGDQLSRYYYVNSGMASIVGGGILIWCSYTASFSLLGPMGIALGLVIAGVVLATAGDNARTTPIEHWLRRSCFGLPRDTDKPWLISQPLDLADAINAYYIIISGMRAELTVKPIYGGATVHTNWGDVPTLSAYNIQLQAFLPGFVVGQSKVNVTITVNGAADPQKFRLTEADVSSLLPLDEKDKTGRAFEKDWRIELNTTQIAYEIVYLADMASGDVLTLYNSSTFHELLRNAHLIT